MFEKVKRDLTLARMKDQYGRSLNLLDGKMWMDRISERIEVIPLKFSESLP